MSLRVAKFGGSSLATPERLRQVACKIAAQTRDGVMLVVVVSAMEGETDRLANLASRLAASPDPDSQDAVLASGELLTSGLVAVALGALGVPARSFMGWQAGIRTEGSHGGARIASIIKEPLRNSLAAGQVPVVTGFQGLTSDHRLTTLGRGGSDLTAVAIAAALRAESCWIYTDVAGVYTADPRIVAKARPIVRLTYEEMLEMASLGSRVLQTRSVSLASQFRVPVRVVSTFEDSATGTWIALEEEDGLEQPVVSSIAYSRNEAKVTITRLPDRPGIAAAVFGALAERDVNVDMIVQSASGDGRTTDLTFSVAESDLALVRDCLGGLHEDVRYDAVLTDSDVVKISVIGLGMRSHAGVAAQMFRALAEHGINIQVIATSEIKISVLIAAAFAELAVRVLHDTYGLGKG